MPGLVHVESGKVVIDGRPFPLERVTAFRAEELKPRYRPWLIALGLSVLAIPALNALHLAIEQLVFLPYSLVAVVLFAAIFRVTFGETTYALVVDLAGQRKVALKSTDQQLIASVLEDAQDVLRGRPGHPG